MQLQYLAGVTTWMMPVTVSSSSFLEPCSGTFLNLQSDKAGWVLFLLSCRWGRENISQATELFWGWESDLFEEAWMFSELNIHPSKDLRNCWGVLASRLNFSLLQCYIQRVGGRGSSHYSVVLNPGHRNTEHADFHQLWTGYCLLITTFLLRVL